jgi:hypothetical protein
LLASDDQGGRGDLLEPVEGVVGQVGVPLLGHGRYLRRRARENRLQLLHQRQEFR